MQHCLVRERGDGEHRFFHPGQLQYVSEPAVTPRLYFPEVHRVSVIAYASKEFRDPTLGTIPCDERTHGMPSI
jgi:hypothetical protein